MNMTHPSKVRVLEPLVIFLLIGASLIYAVNAFNTGNFLWFQKENNIVRPNRIVIVDNGQRVTLQPGHPDFEAMAGAVETSLARLSNTDLVSIGLSEQTLEDYATESLVVELYFDAPVTLHSLARSGEPRQLLIPINGRHANGGYVFRGDQGEWWFGAVRMANPQPLFTALSEMGYAVTAARPTGSG